MFWSKGRKKTEEAVLEEVRDSLGQWCGLLEQMRQGQMEEAGKLAAVLEENRQAAQEEAKVLRRQSESVEDLLDFMQEEAEKKSALEEQLQESREREEALLALACCAREQLELVTQRLMEDASWREQCRMLEQEAEKYLRDADMRETGKAGEPVDYELHQVLDAVDTDKEELAGTVARVYRRGRIYRGKVIRKAQVAAYRAASASVSGS